MTTRRLDLLDDVDWLRRRHVVDGVDATGIAAEAGVCKVTAYRALRRHGIWRPTRRRIDRDLLWRRYVDEGVDAVTLARQAGVTRQGVYWALRAEGIDLEDRGAGGRAVSRPVGPLAAQVRLAGLSAGEAAHLAGISRRSWQRSLASGRIGAEAADRLAVGLGLHPALV